MSLLVATFAVSAQNLAKNEAKALNAFLSQTSAKGSLNGAALEWNSNNLSDCPGLKVENGHVTEIDLHGKDLAGSLDL